MRPLVALLLGLMLTCQPQSGHAASRFIGEPRPYPTLIVFVHGLTGGSDTWRQASGQPDWPQVVRADPLFRTADIYVHEYPSAALGRGGPTIDQLAARMSRELQGPTVNIQRYERVVFIAHSLGGILARRAILTTPALQRNTEALYLFGTPMQGSWIADFARPFGTAVVGDLVAMGAYGNATDRVSRDWIRTSGISRIKSFCAYEKLPTGPARLKLLVVKVRSAERLCNEDLQEVETDHIDLVKVSSPVAFQHALVRQWYMETFPAVERSVAIETDAPVLIASCRFDRYGNEFNSAIAGDLKRMGYGVRLTQPLPVDWEASYLDMLWRKVPPKLLIIHLSCFQDSVSAVSREDNIERAVDFIRFLSTLRVAGSGVSVLVYSRAFITAPDYLDEQEVVRAFKAAKRLERLPIKIEPPFAADPAQRADFEAKVTVLMRWVQVGKVLD